jgi:hypothetical protein
MMSSYLFHCNHCLKPFTKQLSFQENEDDGFVCPFCRSGDVRQEQSVFYPDTTEKIAEPYGLHFIPTGHRG